MSLVDRPETTVTLRPARRSGGARGWVSDHVRLAITLDFCCALAAGVSGFVFRFGDDAVAPRPDAALAATLPFIWVCWVAATRAYEARFFGAGTEEYRRIFDAGISLTAAVAVLSYATKAEVARGFVVFTLPVVTLLSLLGRYRLRKHLHGRRAKGECLRRAVAVGHRQAVAELVREFGRARHHGMQIVAVCLPEDGGPARVGGVPVEGGMDEVAEVVRRCHADTVAVLACPELAGVELRRLAWRLEKTDTELLVASALLDIAGPRTSIRPVAGLPLLHVEHPELTGTRRVLKALFDRTAAAVALVLLSPLWALTALLIRLDDPGPAFFSQVRVGLGGRAFRMLKFRTMVVDAERRRRELTDPDPARGVLFKLRDDPRVTRLGSRLRRWSIDELPQLVNVVRGEMSLVGPRPPLPDEVDRYGEDVFRRLAVKPGMTGLWQVSGRSDLSWEESVRLDVRYIENWSLFLDVQILWKTLAAVTRGSGAY
ncbi:sugar transferase [Actinomadura litoris]|uniref:Exopolysaccharide biosynthesis polyprenyl glycosylphosphotransferase n=1 Tax=Actinomadura litoris TaxID=2678616 RepID=A0A7K1KY99_9ACTN|nr:sugar transferase [Actinomadura litoris]MUN37180.1 exopolysaccharide biosynthesis polyprenyl glycosylphosphotransferase [Actinomadura litoris]